MIVDTCPTCDQIVDEEDILKSTQNLFGSACVDCGDNFNSIHNGEYDIVTLVIQREEDLSVSVRCNDCHMRNMMKQGDRELANIEIVQHIPEGNFLEFLSGIFFCPANSRAPGIRPCQEGIFQKKWGCLNCRVGDYGFPCVSLRGIPYDSQDSLIAVTDSVIPYSLIAGFPTHRGIPGLPGDCLFPVHSPDCLDSLYSHTHAFPCIPCIPDCLCIAHSPGHSHIFPIAYDSRLPGIPSVSRFPGIPDSQGFPGYVSLGAKPYDLNSPYNYIRQFQNICSGGGLAMKTLI